MTRKKLIVDFFMSAYDTAVCDRKLVPEGSFGAKVAWLLDWVSLKLADIVLADTEEHKQYFCDEFNASRDKIEVIPVGSFDSIFYPRKKTGKEFIVFFYGYFTPLHGIEKIIRAASILPRIRFILVGDGQTKNDIVELVRRLNLKNVSFIKHQSLSKLPLLMKEADICLGIFGDSAKSKRVVSYKVYDALAMKKAVIAARSPALEHFFKHRVNIFLCENTSEDIAKAITELEKNKSLRERIALNGYLLFKKKFIVKNNGLLLKRILEDRLNG